MVLGDYWHGWSGWCAYGLALELAKVSYEDGHGHRQVPQNGQELHIRLAEFITGIEGLWIAGFKRMEGGAFKNRLPNLPLLEPGDRL